MVRLSSEARAANGKQTLIEQLGFQDHDLKTPQHDEIMLWLDGFVSERLADLLGMGGEWLAPYVECRRQAYQASATERLEALEQRLEGLTVDSWDRSRIEKEKAPLEEWQRASEQAPPEWKPPVVTDSIWEYPVGDGKFVAGFLDLAVICRAYYLAIDTDSDGPPRWDWWAEHRSLAFEVKSSIPSLGELIRQIRFYEEKLSIDAVQYGQVVSRKKPPPFYVVSPETRWATVLQKQGIGSVIYPTGEIVLPPKLGGR